MKYIIIDWAYNICFNGQDFKTFDDAWEFIYEKFPNGHLDQTFDEYFVLLKGELEEK